jgi:hypothetical protein
MNKIKFSHVVFSLALIAALAVASLPMTPVLALSTSSPNAVAVGSQVNNTVLAPNTAVVCRSITVWRNGHRIIVRICHKVTKPAL